MDARDSQRPLAEADDPAGAGERTPLRAPPRALLSIVALALCTMSQANPAQATEGVPLRTPREASAIPGCSLSGHALQGRVKVVDAFPDLKVKVVDAFPDLNVRWVDSFADTCGRWQRVDAFPDFTIQFVDAFPDLTIRNVDAFPGRP